MNLPNFLTVLRLFLTIGFTIYAQKSGLFAYALAAALFVIAAITDFLDGYIARKYKLFTNFGKIMDPIADKFLVLSAFFVFMIQGHIVSWMFFIIAGREFAVTVSRLLLMKKGKVLSAEKEGKLKTVLQMSAIIWILGFTLLQRSTSDPSSWVHQQFTLYWVYITTQLLMFCAVGLTLYSGLKYFWNNRKILL
ncbi:MAG: CDP-diacylglycerol--glycerol-3-phosphate 3-phosphatidyltransferase [Candidatus Omnitrophica bacterium]|nr:CDP-diacylglycerol--glycerol-3-phosphate 3-phosphatidyltransferase [Candidatus Omnitrophota bacterium]